MDQQRLFTVAPDAIHVRMHYEPRTGTWTVHHAVVTHDEAGEVHSDPATPYRFLDASEALDVVSAAVAAALGL